MDVSQYLEIFIDETKEHLQSLNTQILNLEQDAENMDTINEIFRAAHSLKGMAGTMGYKRMQNLTHDMENVFSEVRNGNIKVKANMIDILFQCLDALEEYLDTIQSTADEGTNENEHLIAALNKILKGEDGADGDATPAKEAKKEEAKEEAKAEAAAPASGDNWTKIKLGDSERSVIAEAQAQGKNVFGMTVFIQDSCILKAARAFLVFKAVEDLGEILVSEPSAQDIEDEKFEFDFSLIVITEHELDELIKAASAVSEIDHAVGAPVSLDAQAQEGDEPAEEASEEHAKEASEEPAEETKPAVVSPKTAPAAKQDAKKPAAGKPVVNRTVRVDIEKLDSLMNLVSELIIAKNSLVSITSNSESEVSSSTQFNEQIEYLESVTTNLHESVMKVRMVPIESVLQKFPRMIRLAEKTRQADGIVHDR